MSTPAPKNHEHVMKQWSAAFNAHDAVRVAALYAEDTCVSHPSYTGPLQGRKAVQDDTLAYMIAMPNVTSELTRIVGDQDCVAAEITISGVHAGPLVLATGELPPTGRRVRFPLALFCRFGPAGQIVEEHRYYDAPDLLRQLTH
ncbi:ester cyclase [Kocuria aegyptia]